MTISVFSAAILLAGASASDGEMSPVTPMLLAGPVANDEQVVPAGTTAPAPVVSPPAPSQATTRATDQNEIIVTARPKAPPGDPLQEVNAKTFGVTQSVDKALVGPAAQTYKETVPSPVRSGLRNFFNNLREPQVFINYLLQFKPGKAFETLGRFTLNTTLGVAGIFDVAKREPFNLPRRPNGFGNTLGYYGVKPGAYLYLPLVGSTTVRDLVGGTLDQLLLPAVVGAPFNKLEYTLPTGTVRALDSRIESDQELRKLMDTSDPYATMRSTYLKQRQADIDALHGLTPEPVRPVLPGLPTLPSPPGSD